MALIYNYTPPQEGVLGELSREIEVASKGELKADHGEKDVARWSNELEESALFGNLEIRTYPWQCRYSPDQYAGLFQTYSDFRALSPDMQSTIDSLIKETVARNGGVIVRQYECTVFRAGRV